MFTSVKTRSNFDALYHGKGFQPPPDSLNGPKGTGKRGHIVAETLLLMTFPCARKLGNICCGHKMFLIKIRNIFVSRTQNLYPQQMLRARANGETCVSATMCPQQCLLVCQYLKSCRRPVVSLSYATKSALI